MRDKLEIMQDNIRRDNICKLEVDGIICQANTELEMEDETTKKLIKTGGDKIQSECNHLDNLDKGKAAITGAGSLTAKYLIYAIVHDMGEDSEEEHIMSSVREALLLAKERGLKRIALPLLGESCGIPIRRAAELILTEVKKHFDAETSIEKVVLVAHDNATYNAFDEAVKQL